MSVRHLMLGIFLVSAGFAFAIAFLMIVPMSSSASVIWAIPGILLVFYGYVLIVRASRALGRRRVACDSSRPDGRVGVMQ